MTSAVDRWRADLEAWALPRELLDAVDESPYGWPADLFRRRQQAASGSSPTVERTAELAGDGGAVLDIGAGTGRIGLALARRGHPVTLVEQSEAMLHVLETDAADVPGATVVAGSWPDVDAGAHDAVVAANVVYDVQEIGPFLGAAFDRARRALVLEATPRHPWAHLTPYYRRLHDLDRPDGPTVDDLVDVVEEVTGRTPEVERWVEPAGMRFADHQELLDLLARRLLVPDDRRSELLDVVGPDIVEAEGWLYLGDPVREAVLVVVRRRDGLR
ncbi:MAG: class I SAM-dependent methyltransferase [Acidimicrobiia bacterium]|nr:class I SAM-dependent methyltransferase [Acidimicrobiia bacterium]